MNKISLYILLIFIFLGISTSFSPSEQGDSDIINEKVLPNFFKGAPLSVILEKSFKTGFLIKTYYHRYKVIHGFKAPEVVYFKTSPEFWKKNLKNMGMSIFRRNEKQYSESVTVMPPGALYIGDLAYGSWMLENSGHKIWFFHRAYRNFPILFNWKDFKPSYEFYKQMKVHMKSESDYYGNNNQFGTKTSSVNELDTSHNLDTRQNSYTVLKKHLGQLIKLPWNK